MSDQDMTTTTVTIRGQGDYPHAEIATVFHRVDLSDLGEPYLSAVKAARAERDSWRQVDG